MRGGTVAFPMLIRRENRNRRLESPAILTDSLPAQKGPQSKHGRSASASSRFLTCSGKISSKIWRKTFRNRCVSTLAPIRRHSDVQSSRLKLDRNINDGIVSLWKERIFDRWPHTWHSTRSTFSNFIFLNKFLKIKI